MTSPPDDGPVRLPCQFGKPRRWYELDPQPSAEEVRSFEREMRERLSPHAVPGNAPGMVALDSLRALSAPPRRRKRAR